MYKTKETDQAPENQAFENQANTPATGQERPAENQAEKPRGDLTVEEHARWNKTPAPVFAAVMEAEGWAGGKRVPEAEYKEAVTRFLKGPAGGNAPAGKKEA